MKTSRLLFLVPLLLNGCATAEKSYIFDVHFERPEEWTQVYPAARDKNSLKYQLLNDSTGARMLFFSDSTFYRSPESMIGDIKVRFAQGDFHPADIVYDGDRQASFTFEFPQRGLKGKVAVLRASGTDRRFVVIGRWPAEADVQATADMDAILKDLTIWAEN